MVISFYIIFTHYIPLGAYPKNLAVNIIYPGIANIFVCGIGMDRPSECDTSNFHVRTFIREPIRSVAGLRVIANPPSVFHETAGLSRALKKVGLIVWLKRKRRKRKPKSAVQIDV
jgi:hypothetical protein